MISNSRNLIITFFLALLVVACNDNKETTNNSVTEKTKMTPEQIALEYFIDSILYSNQSLEFDLSKSTVRLPPPIDEKLYENGLFIGFDIYSTNEIEEITIPYVDTLQNNLAIEEFGKGDPLFDDLWLSYLEGKNDSTKIALVLKSPIIIESEVEFHSKRTFNGLYLSIKKGLKIDSGTLIQFEFSKYTNDVFDQFSLYFLIDEDSSILEYFWH